MRGNLSSPCTVSDAAVAAHAPAQLLDAVHRRRAEVGPGDVGELAEQAVEVVRARRHQPVRQQVQAQVRVAGAGGRVVGVDGELHGLHVHSADLVVALGRGVRLERLGHRLLAQADLAEPGVEHRAVVGDGGQATSPCSRHRRPPFACTCHVRFTTCCGPPRRSLGCPRTAPAHRRRPRCAPTRSRSTGAPPCAGPSGR